MFSNDSYKMVNCDIKGCNSTNIKGRSTYRPLISIPKNDRKLWEVAFQFPLPKDARVCTLHFNESDFIKGPPICFIKGNQGTTAGPRKLKPGTLPACLKGTKTITRLNNCSD